MSAANKSEAQPSSNNNARLAASQPGEHRPQVARGRNAGLACDPCRKLKVKCDKTRPVCASCVRLGNGCKYELVRRKTGPRKGHLRHLYDKLAHMEALLQGAEQSTEQGSASVTGRIAERNASTSSSSSSSEAPVRGSSSSGENKQAVESGKNILQLQTSSDPTDELLEDLGTLDLDDRPPTPEVTDALDEAYFKNVYTTVPLFHRSTFLASRDPTLATGPLKGLRYAMWALAAGTHEQYSSLQDLLYRKARRTLQADENREAEDTKEDSLDLEHCQAWLLITIYEFKKLAMSRAWMSAGRAVRLAQLLSLQRLDAAPIVTAKQILAPPRDAIEGEVRRRTFWLVFWADRCASMGLGWPTAFPEKDVSIPCVFSSFLTQLLPWLPRGPEQQHALTFHLLQIATALPDFEERFQAGHAGNTPSLSDVLDSRALDYSPMAATAANSALLGRIINHLHQPWGTKQTEEMQEKFWQRHREIEGALMQFATGLPHVLRIPHGLTDPNTQFLHVNIRVCTVCLSQTFMLLAGKYRVAPRFIEENRMRCVTAATEITNIMRTTCYQDLATMNSFLCYGLYVAAMVFLQHLEERGSNEDMMFSLKFLFAAIQAFAKLARNAEMYLNRLTIEIDKTTVDCGGQRLTIKSQLWGDTMPNSSGKDNVTAETQTLGEDTEDLYDPFTRLMKREESPDPIVLSNGGGHLTPYREDNQPDATLPTWHLNQVFDLARQQARTDDSSFSFISGGARAEPSQASQVWHVSAIPDVYSIGSSQTLSNTVFPWAGDVPAMPFAPEPATMSHGMTPSTLLSQVLGNPKEALEEGQGLGTPLYANWDSPSNMQWATDWLDFNPGTFDLE